MLKLKNNEIHCIVCACVFVISFALNLENLLFGGSSSLIAVVFSVLCPISFLFVLFNQKQNRTSACDVVLIVYSCILAIFTALFIFTTVRNPDWSEAMMIPILVFMPPFCGINGLLHLLPVEAENNLLLFLLLFAMSICGVAVSAKNLTRSKAK